MANVNLTPDRDATSSASPSHGNVYDVFLNHRGPDVKKTLASHIHLRLKERGIKVFLDQKEFQQGEEITEQIKEAIRTASVHVAIFSPNYAESSWCLDELVLMLKSRSESRSTVIPVFYNVKPSVLRWARGGDGVYARSLGVLEKKRTYDSQPRYDSNTIGKWRDALSAVADISGFELEACNGDEGELVDKVVQQVVNLKSLQSLDLSECSTLQALPDSVGNLTGLRSLDLSCCSTLQALPDSVGNLTGLRTLDLGWCSTLQALPDSVGNLTGLQSLDLGWCSTLQALPDSVGNLTGLRTLDLRWCSTLQALPESVGNLTGLQSLDLSWCSTLQSLPDSVGNLTGLQSLALSRCSTLQALPDSVGNLTGIQRLQLSGCSNLQMLPNVEHLSSLKKLDVSESPKLQWGAGVVEQLRQRLGEGFIELKKKLKLVVKYNNTS